MDANKVRIDRRFHHQTRSFQWRIELDNVLRENDMLKNANSNNENEISRVKNKLKSAEDALKELRNSFNHIKSEVCYHSSTSSEEFVLVVMSIFPAREAAERLPR